MLGSLSYFIFYSIKAGLSYRLRNLLSGIGSLGRQMLLSGVMPPAGIVTLGGSAEKYGFLNICYCGKGV